MYKLILYIICSIFLISNVNADFKKAVINNVDIVNSNYEKFDFDIISADNKVEFKYLISSNVLFEIKGSNFIGNNFKGTLKIIIGDEIYENQIYYTKNTNSTIYFSVKEIRDLVLASMGKSFKFEFCPYSESELNLKCGASNTYFIKEEKYTYNDEYYNFQYYMKDMNIENAKDIVTENNIPVIAVIDDGISLLHEDLEGRIWYNEGEINGNGIDDDNNGFTDDKYGWNFVDGNNIMFPKGDHGTGVSGLIGANSNNNLGIAGITNSVKLMPIITCGDIGCINIGESIIYAVDNGADIINLSLGGQWYGYNLDSSDAIQYAVSKGVIVVIAMGNGDNTLTDKGVNTTVYKISPVCNEGKPSDIIGVSALSIFSDKTKNGLKPYWTNYGSCSDVYAYGEDISLMKRDGTYDNNNDGTSFSSPIIAGIIGLGFNQYGKVSNEIVYKSLQSSSNQWHGLDAKKYIENLGINIKNTKLEEKINVEKDFSIALKEKYKKIFSESLGSRLEKLPVGTLKALIIKIDTVIYKRSENKELVPKLEALKEVIQDILSL